MQVYVEDEDLFLYHDGSAWTELSSNLATLEPGMLGVNTAADRAARLSVAADAARFSHDAATPGTGGRAALPQQGAQPRPRRWCFRQAGRATRK
jgi:hypothetical protein